MDKSKLQTLQSEISDLYSKKWKLDCEIQQACCKLDALFSKEINKYCVQVSTLYEEINNLKSKINCTDLEDSEKKELETQLTQKKLEVKNIQRKISSLNKDKNSYWRRSFDG